jgi:hypothetical protein
MGVTILRETDLDGVDLSGVDLATTLMPRGYQPASPAPHKNETSGAKAAGTQG